MHAKFDQPKYPLLNNIPSFIMDRVLMKNADNKADREEGTQAPHSPDAVTGPGRLDPELLGTGTVTIKRCLTISPLPSRMHLLYTESSIYTN